MSTKRFKQILPTSKFALSQEEDTYSSVALGGDMREIPEVETGENILVEEVFEDERNESTKYRISAQIDFLALVNDPYVGYKGFPTTASYQSLPNPANSGCPGWDPFDDPNDEIYTGQSNYQNDDIYPQLNVKNGKNNWFVKVLYPESYLPNNTQISFSTLFHSTVKIHIQDGLPIVGVNFVKIDEIIYPCFITETDVQLEPNDYVYINPNYIQNVDPAGTFKLAYGMCRFQRVLQTDLNGVDLNISLNGMLPADSKLFIIDYPITNYNKISVAQQNLLSISESTVLQNLDTLTFNGSYKRVIGVSKDDLDNETFTTSTNILSVDDDGTTNPNGQYTKITYTTPHGLAKGFYVEFVKAHNTTTPYNLNPNFTGIFRVSSIINEFEFIIDGNMTTAFFPPQSLTYRGVDAIASDYKIRMFKELSEIDDYIVDKAAFATNIYADGTFLLNVNKDIDTNGLTDYLGRPLSELFVGIIKRAGAKDYDWSNVVSHYSHILRGIEGNTETGLGDPGYTPIPGVLPVTSYATTSNSPIHNQTTFPLENTYGISTYPSTRQINNFGTNTVTNGEYLGDLVEYNRGELTERVISDIYHRFNTTWRAFGYYNGCDGFGSSYEGMFYKPFHSFPIRKWAAAVEAATPPAAQPNDPFSAYTETIQFEGVPTYAEEVQGLKIWRDLLDPGIIDSEGGIDNPFLNGAHYLYDNIKISLRRQTPGRSGFDIRVNNPNFLPANTTYTPNENC